jgi:hypothetical protein
MYFFGGGATHGTKTLSEAKEIIGRMVGEVMGDTKTSTIHLPPCRANRTHFNHGQFFLAKKKR